MTDEEIQEYEDDEGPNCPVCGTEMSVTENFMFWHCCVCGYNERLAEEEP